MRPHRNNNVITQNQAPNLTGTSELVFHKGINNFKLSWPAGWLNR